MQITNVISCSAAASQPDSLHFKHTPHLEYIGDLIGLEWKSGFGVKDERFDTTVVGISKIYAGVGAPFNNAHRFQSCQCLTNSTTAGVKFLSEIAFRRKALRRLVATFADE